MIFDIILVVLLLVMCTIGYFVGFSKTLIKIASLFTGLLAAILLAKPLAQLLCNIGLQEPITNKIFANITATDAYANLTMGTEGMATFLTDLGLPNFLSEVLAKGLSETMDAPAIALSVSEGLSYALLCLIAFLFLLIFSGLIFFIAKLIVKGLRKHSVVFRVCDGIAGIIIFAVFYILFIYIVLLILSLLLQVGSVDAAIGNFCRAQLHLTDDGFGLTAYLYKHNIIGNLFKLFF